MSKFSDKCKELLTENGYNVYRLSQTASLERTALQRMITGKRLPGIEFVEAFCNALRISHSDKKELIELYKMEQMGESTYRNHATFFQLFHTLSDIEKEGSVHNHIIVDSRNVKLTSPVSANKYETEILMQYLLNEAIQEEEPLLYTNLPGTNTLLPHHLKILVSQYSHKTVTVKHMIQFQTNIAYAYENLETLQQIIPLCCSRGIHYIPFYYYSKISRNDQSNLIYPFYIITKNYVLQFSSDLSSGILHSDPVILQQYNQEFQICLEHSAPLLQQTNTIDEALQLYMASCDTIKDIVSLASTPCTADLIKPSHLFRLLKEQSPQYLRLIKVFEPFLDVLNNADRTDFFTYNGFQNYCKSGECCGAYNIVIPEIPPEDRIQSLKHYLKHYNSDTSQMLNSHFSYPNTLYTEFRNHNSLYLINLADKENISFIIIQESSICHAFTEFFQLLTNSEYIVPEEDTLDIFQKNINILEQK